MTPQERIALAKSLHAQGLISDRELKVRLEYYRQLESQMKDEDSEAEQMIDRMHDQF